MSNLFRLTAQCKTALCEREITSLHVADIADMVQTSEINQVEEASRLRSLCVDLASQRRKLPCSARVLSSQPKTMQHTTNRHH